MLERDAWGMACRKAVVARQDERASRDVRRRQGRSGRMAILRRASK